MDTNLDLAVANAPASSRYEARRGDDVAGYAEYSDESNVRTFPHTVVEPRFEGQGVGSALIRGALDDTREAGMQIVPVCQFVRAFIDKHPDYADLVAS